MNFLVKIKGRGQEEKNELFEKNVGGTVSLDVKPVLRSKG